MHYTKRATALSLMRDALPALKVTVDRVRREDRDLGNQMRRAAQSVLLNLAEADGNRGGNRRLRIETALGSLRETREALHIAAAWGYVEAAAAEELDRLLDRAAAMSWRRLQRAR